MRKFTYLLLNALSPAFKIFRRKNLRVLAYHDIIDKNAFDNQLNYLGQEYSIIGIPTLKDHFFNNTPLPEFPLLITFDDGDITVLDPGSYILEKYNFPSCLFVISDLINSKVNYWTDTVRINERKSGSDPSSIKKILRDLKALPNEERLVKMQYYEETEKLQLTTAELVRLQEKNVWIGNHSHTHPMFDKCTKEEINEELVMFKKAAEEWGVGDYQVFAYPNGNNNDISEEILKKNKIELAFLFDHKINSEIINPWKISRIRVDSNTSMPEFRVKVSGLHSALIALKRSFF